MFRPARGNHMALLKPATLGQRPQTSETLVIDPELLLRATPSRFALDRQHRIAIAPPDPNLGAIVADREVTLLDPRRWPRSRPGGSSGTRNFRSISTSASNHSATKGCGPIDLGCSAPIGAGASSQSRESERGLRLRRSFFPPASSPSQPPTRHHRSPSTALTSTEPASHAGSTTATNLSSSPRSPAERSPSHQGTLTEHSGARRLAPVWRLRGSRSGRSGGLL